MLENGIFLHALAAKSNSTDGHLCAATTSQQTWKKIPVSTLVICDDVAAHTFKKGKYLEWTQKIPIIG